MILRRIGLALDDDLTLSALTDRLAETHGDRLVVDEEGGPRLTHAENAALVARWSGAIAAKTAPGDRVVIALPNGWHQLAACLAASRAGAVPVPVNPRMRPDEIEHVIVDSGASLTVDDVALLAGPVLDEAFAATPDDLAAVFYTSGTTGRPKGAELTHRAIVGSLRRSALWPAGVRRDEVVLALPIAHIMGFVVHLGMAIAGIPVYLQPTFDAAAVLDAIEQRRSTAFVGVPAMYRMLLEAGAERRDLRSVRVWASGADAMPGDLARRFQRMGATATLPIVGTSVGQALFLEAWGMVETGGAAIGRVAIPGPWLPFIDNFAVPLPGYELRVVDDDGNQLPRGQVGELLVKGPGVLRGYHGDPDATADALTGDGWLRTGDLARKGPFGSVAFAGRKKDVVKAGGFSVFAAEVERAITEHPGVLEAAVVGIPDRRLGEVPAAAVRVAPGSEVTVDDVLETARQRLAAYKVPRQVVFVDELPRGGTGKVQKERLRPLFS